MSIHYGQFCPIAKAAEALGEPWTILIIRELLLETTRFSELQRALSRISPTLLSKRLTQLQDRGLVIRRGSPRQRRTEYHLTAAGRELHPVVLGLGKWGMKWARGQMTEDDLDVELLMHDFSRRIDRSQLPGGQNVVQFIFTDLSRYASWWIVLKQNGERELCADNPGRDADILLRTDLRTMTEIWAGDTELRAARKAGRLQLAGNPILIRTLPYWLRIGVFARKRTATAP